MKNRIKPICITQTIHTNVKQLINRFPILILQMKSMYGQIFSNKLPVHYEHGRFITDWCSTVGCWGWDQINLSSESAAMTKTLATVLEADNRQNSRIQAAGMPACQANILYCWVMCFMIYPWLKWVLLFKA